MLHKHHHLVLPKMERHRMEKIEKWDPIFNPSNGSPPLGAPCDAHGQIPSPCKQTPYLPNPTQKRREKKRYTHE